MGMSSPSALPCCTVAKLALMAIAALASASAAQTAPTSGPSTPSRDQQVRQDHDRLNAEALRLGGWEQWSQQLSGFAAQIQKRLDNRPVPAKNRSFIAKDSPLAGHDGFLFSARRTDQIPYEIQLNRPDKLGDERYEKAFRAIADFSAQLKSRGIDLLVVPVPDKCDVYPELLAELPQPDLSVQLRSKQLFLRLLRADVEVVDLAPLLLAHKRQEPPLYMRRDTHWSPVASKLAAAELARRLMRYDFVQHHARQPARYVDRDKVLRHNGDLAQNWVAAGNKPFPPEQYKLPAVYQRNGKPPHVDNSSPIWIMGDSYVDFWGSDASVWAYLAAQINLPPGIHTQPGGGCNVPPTFATLLRKGSAPPRVLIWLFTSCSLYETDFASADLPKHDAKPAPRQPAIVEAEILSDPPTLNPAQAPYPHALVTLQLSVRKVVEGNLPDKQILAIFPLMADRKLLPASAYRKGQHLRLQLQIDVPTKQASWMMLDDTDDFSTVPYYATPQP